MRHACAATTAAFLIFSCAGCRTGGAADRYGKVFYLDGAGNWSDGGTGVASGLRAAGFHGDVEEYVWTTSFNPLVDQVNIVAAKVRAAELARKIERYRRRYPDNPLHIVALSAGTGVATWAVEQLEGEVGIDNMVMLGSSISHDYDMSAALSHMTGRIYVYSSPHDCVLETVRKVGTIDGKRGVESAGAVGLTAPADYEDRVVNTRWSREWLRYGWTGAHSDCTNAEFVRREIARHVMTESTRRKARLAAGGAVAPAVLTASDQ